MGPQIQTPTPSLACAAYTVLRHHHRRLPPLSPALTLAREGDPEAVRAVNDCFAAARRLLPGEPANALLFAELLQVNAAVASSLIAVVDQVESTLDDTPTADALGPLFEAGSGSGERKQRGQHFTPPAVVALVLALARAGSAANVMDPTCGSGAFLIQAAAQAPGATLWGCELDPLAAQLARINLTSGQVAPVGHVHTGDLLALLPGTHIDGQPLPRCEAVVGNLPYVRLHRQDLARWRAALGERWATRDPTFVTGLRPPKLRLSGHADLYALLFFHLTDLVAPGGRLAVLTANAYLDAGYGQVLKQLFLRHFDVLAVVESRREPWFADASVNTVITVLQRKGKSPHGRGPATRFVQLTRPLLSSPDKSRAADPAALARTIENARPTAKETAGPADLPYVTLQTSDCRIRLVEPTQLESSLTEPWTAYLRAPDLYFRLRQHPALRPAGEVMQIRRGVTTNWNAFFYPPSDTGVEPQYLTPVVRSPRVSRTIAVRISDLPDRLFVCPKQRSDLQNAAHCGALEWIERGLQMQNQQGRPIRETLKRSPWYRLDPKPYRLLLTKTTHDTHLHRLVDEPVAVDQRLYGVTPTVPADTELTAALVNSSLVALMTEVVGVASLGDGALDLPVTIARQQLLVPDPAALSAAARHNILDAFRKLVLRPCQPVWQETLQADRQDLDRAVLAGLGLDVEATLPLLYDELCALTRERLTLAKRRRAL